jgi:hypothetical protein
MDSDLDRFAHWHELLDEQCNRAGFADSMALAAEFCAATNGSGRSQFETAIRNLNNWRSGRHLPRPRSVRVLERLLKIGDDPKLLEKWNQLYQRARLDEPELGEASALVAPEARRRFAMPGGAGKPIALGAAGAALFGLGLVAGTVIGETGWRPWGGPADDAPMIFYRPEVTLTVGQSQVIHGERGDCGKLPREWNELAGNLPTSKLGVFSDGGLVQRNSMYCKGVTPARGVRFTATNAGVEEAYIAGDYMKITVKDVGGNAAPAGEPEPAG